MSNLLEVKYYCPLKVLVYEEDEYGCIDELSGYELDGRFADAYEYEIREKMREYCESDEEDMAVYFNADHKNITKLQSATWDFESVNGVLYGCVKASLTEYFSDEEEQAFKDWVRGQNSDGLGEGFEQRKIETTDGEMYVSLWHSGDDYYVDNAHEFRCRIHQDIGMGGM